MKILVTGASGFIGNHVLNYLTTNTSYDIIATSRLKEKVINKPWFNLVSFIQADLHSENSNWFEYFNKPDILIHLAWPNLPNYTKSFHLTENLSRDIKFIDNLLINGLTRLVVTGTCFEYGMQEGELNEEMPTFPEHPYAIAKDALRRYLENKIKENNVFFKWLRLFYMYGVGQSSNSIIPQLQNAIDNGDLYFNMSGGEQIRDYLPVEKVAEYIVKVSLNNDLRGVINIASGNPIKLRIFLAQYLKSIGKEIQFNLGFYPYSSTEPMEFWGNNFKIKNL
jgi:dTDP-6-deoxy-L-talose 4-dehydrogenase (NAD+)